MQIIYSTDDFHCNKCPIPNTTLIITDYWFFRNEIAKVNVIQIDGKENEIIKTVTQNVSLCVRV